MMNIKVVSLFPFLQGIWLFSVITLGPVTYDEKSYPTWAVVFGWCLGIASMLPIPILALRSLLTEEGTLSQVKTIFSIDLLACSFHFQAVNKVINR